MFNPDFNASGQHAFANLGMSGSLDALVDAHTRYGMQGFLSIQHIGVWATPFEHNVGNNQTGLESGWVAALAKSLVEAKPHLQSKALAGIFLGDERSCGGIPFSNVTAVADAVKAFLKQHAPSALVYINECAGPFAHCYKANGTDKGEVCVDCNKATPGVKCWGPKIPSSIVSTQLQLL
jgi:hypothetical protein